VTIPPPGWTNAAHRNGVPVLGTFITEWDAGAEACTKIFESTATAAVFASKLVEIAKYYGFDGWLVSWRGDELVVVGDE
jgi:mannosyl-glycoprotein endo-beta-N-acetylglucosaminidase